MVVCGAGGNSVNNGNSKNGGNNNGYYRFGHLFIITGCLRLVPSRRGVTRATQVPLCNQATFLLQPTC